jgi:hypothetical protein
MRITLLIRSFFVVKLYLRLVETVHPENKITDAVTAVVCPMLGYVVGIGFAYAYRQDVDSYERAVSGTRAFYQILFDAFGYFLCLILIELSSYRRRDLVRLFNALRSDPRKRQAAPKSGGSSDIELATTSNPTDPDSAPDPGRQEAVQGIVRHVMLALFAAVFVGVLNLASPSIPAGLTWGVTRYFWQSSGGAGGTSGIALSSFQGWLFILTTGALYPILSNVVTDLIMKRLTMYMVDEPSENPNQDGKPVPSAASTTDLPGEMKQGTSARASRISLGSNDGGNDATETFGREPEPASTFEERIVQLHHHNLALAAASVGASSSSRRPGQVAPENPSAESLHKSFSMHEMPPAHRLRQAMQDGFSIDPAAAFESMTPELRRFLLVDGKPIPDLVNHPEMPRAMRLSCEKAQKGRLVGSFMTVGMSIFYFTAASYVMLLTQPGDASFWLSITTMLVTNVVFRIFAARSWRRTTLETWAEIHELDSSRWNLAENAGVEDGAQKPEGLRLINPLEKAMGVVAATDMVYGTLEKANKKHTILLPVGSNGTSKNENGPGK